LQKESQSTKSQRVWNQPKSREVASQPECWKSEGRRRVTLRGKVVAGVLRINSGIVAVGGAIETKWKKRSGLCARDTAKGHSGSVEILRGEGRTLLTMKPHGELRQGGWGGGRILEIRFADLVNRGRVVGQEFGTQGFRHLKILRGVVGQP